MAPGGYKLPSIGTINILLVFAEFPDDNYDTTNTRWIKNSPPTNMANWVDETWSTNPTIGSLTDYFNTMSGNKLKITGKEIYIKAPRTREEYQSLSMKRGHIQREILTQLDETMNFAEFDNWSSSGDYTHDNTPNTFVDMIIFVWRNTYQDNSSYATSLDFGNNYGDLGRIGSFDVDRGLRHINTSTFGSGVSIRGYLQTGKYLDPFRLVLHEFSHYLLGYNDMHNGYGFWGMLSDWGIKSNVANSFERYQLQWIDDPSGYYTIDLTTKNAPIIYRNLSDLISSRQPIRIKINNNEYFYIENHKSNSYWETHTPFAANPNKIDGTIEPGIYIIRQSRMSNSTDQYSKMLIPADGRFEWNARFGILNPYGGIRVLPVWERVCYDRLTGYHTLEMVFHSLPGVENPSQITLGYKNTPPYWEMISEIEGDGNDAFRKGYKEIFSPWSNPNNQRENITTINFTMELETEYTNGDYYLKFYLINPSDSKPSKPENLKVTCSSNFNPLLTWDSNIEPDKDAYVIERTEANGIDYPFWENIATVTTTSYIDYDVAINPVFEDEVSYRIKALDTQGKLSIPSSIATIGDAVLHKLFAESNVFYNFEIDAYPNPFNPSTTIRYQIPEDGMVTLKVYDVLGREVKTLVDEYKPAGSYKINFDASRLASGLYIYDIKSGGNRIAKKMTLVK